MENYGLTHPNAGEINPLRYHLTLGKRGLELHFTELGWAQLNKVLRHKYAKKLLPNNFVPPDYKEWGIDGVLTTKGQSLRNTAKKDEYIVVYVPSNQKDKLSAIAETLSHIFLLDHQITADTVKKEGGGSRDDIQLFSLETMFSKEEEFHGAGLSFSVAPKAAVFLGKHPPGTLIPNAVKEMKSQWLKISGVKRKESRYTDQAFTAHLREYGMLSLSTMGNCACLGEVPEELGENRGFGITSHNVDYAPQQINLLIGLACVWDWVRESLAKETA